MKLDVAILAAVRKKMGLFGHLFVAHGADITGARYDGHTRWPSGFDPARHGAILVRQPR
jgi:hypothetical protein